jgi:hypothetical protein
MDREVIFSVYEKKLFCDQLGMAPKGKRRGAFGETLSSSNSKGRQTELSTLKNSDHLKALFSRKSSA